jgi:hypothetical protein
VAELRQSSATLTRAFQLYREGSSAPTAQARLAALESCLRVCPEFPGARVAWALTAHELKVSDHARIERYLREHLELYPHDFPAALAGLPVLIQIGAGATARELAEKVATEARRLGGQGVLPGLAPYLQG